jgi:hypothetical protein
MLIIRKVQGKTKPVDYLEVKEVAERLSASADCLRSVSGLFRDSEICAEG